MDVQVMTWLQNEATTPPPSGNLYPKGGKTGKKVENLQFLPSGNLYPNSHFCRKKVEIPIFIVRKSLPK